MATHRFCRTASFVIFMLFLRTGRPDIVVAPNNSEVQIGGSTYFNCSTSSTSEEIHWFHYPIGSQDRSFVYSFNQFYPPYLGRFSLEKNDTTGEYNLVLTSIKAEDAGKYECQDKAGSGMKQSAQLIILEKTESLLVCQSNVNVNKVIGPNACGIKPDQLVLSCMVQYRGNEAPILQWGLNDSKTPITSGVTHQINGNSAVYNLTMTTDQISNGSFYVCQTTRSTTKISCKSGEIKVVLAKTAEVQGVSDGGDSYKVAIICIFIFLLLPLSIAVIVLILMLRYNWKPKLTGNIRDCFPCCENAKNMQSIQLHPTEDKNNEDDNQITEKPADTETNESNQVDKEELETTNVQSPLIDCQSGEPSSVPETRSECLQSEIYALCKRIDRRNETIKELQQRNDWNMKSLDARVKYLEQHLYPKEDIGYASKPDSPQTVRLSEEIKGRLIIGITVLGTELFVAARNSQEIEVYDSITFQYSRKCEIREMTDSLDIASSKMINCLYIIAFARDVTGGQIMRLDPNGKVLVKWSIGGENGRLSTYESSVVLCLLEKLVIIEYSPKGEIITKVSLSPATKLNNPLHAIKVTSMHFVVSHSDITTKLHRVCVVDLDGNIKKVSTEKMEVPICLLEDDDRLIIVADRRDKRILLLNSQLQYQMKLAEAKHGMKDGHNPVRICFDCTKSKLFVAVHKRRSEKKGQNDCRILIFNIK